MEEDRYDPAPDIGELHRCGVSLMDRINLFPDEADARMVLRSNAGLTAHRPLTAQTANRIATRR